MRGKDADQSASVMAPTRWHAAHMWALAQNKVNAAARYWGGDVPCAFDPERSNEDKSRPEYDDAARFLVTPLQGSSE